MPPLPDNLIYLARKVRSRSGVWAHDWEMQVHTRSAALGMTMPVAGDFCSQPPDLLQIWRVIYRAAVEKTAIGTSIPSLLS